MPSRTLSVAMATYNGAAHLGEQLTSLAQQSRPPDELVVCDDASTDATTDVLRAFAAAAPFPVHVHHNPFNVGYNRNFAAAMDRCRGDVVLLCDQDDAWGRHKLARVEAAYDRCGGPAVVMVDQEICDENLVPSGRTKLGNVHSGGLDLSYYVPGCASAIDRRWLDIILPIPDGVAYDTWIIKPAHHLGVVHIVDEPLQRYRRHAGNASHDVTSRGTRVSRLDAIRGHGRAATLAGWQAEGRDATLMLDRLLTHRAELAAAGWSDGLDPAVTRLQRRGAALQARARIVARPRRGRPMPVVGLLAQGDYRHFQGWRSAIRDVVR